MRLGAVARPTSSMRDATPIFNYFAASPENAVRFDDVEGEDYPGSMGKIIVKEERDN
jgi:hypothetical protein